MTKKILAVVMATVLAMSLGLTIAVPVEADPGPGIAGLWHLDEGSGTTAADSSGNDNHGVLRLGTALSFDGNDFVSIPDPGGAGNLDGFSQLTLEAWIKPANSVSGYHTIVSKYNTWTDFISYYLNLVDGELRILVATDDSNYAYLTTNNANIAVNTWYHVAGTWNGSTLRLYINGAEDTDTTLGSVGTLISIQDETMPVEIGSLYSVWSNDGARGDYFDGIIDEVRISDVARTSFETCGVPIVDSNTVGLWHLDDGSGTTATDDSGNDSHGQLGSGDNEPTWVDFGPNWVTGICGNALSFNGDDWVCVPDDASLDITSELTIEAWVKTDVTMDTNAKMQIVDKGEHQYHSAYMLMIWQGNLYGRVGSSSTTCQYPYPTDCNWHHVAYTFESGEQKLYIDGSVVAENTGTGLTANNQPLFIGNGINRSYYWDGLIDEVIIWDEVMPPICGPALGATYSDRAYLSGLSPCAVDATPVFVADPSGLSLGLNQYESDTEIRWFAEKQFVCVTGLSYDSDGNGTNDDTYNGRVNGYFVHMEPTGTSNEMRGRGCIEFPNDIIGIITNDAGLEATDGNLGLDDVTYSTGVINRGLEMGSGWDYQDLVEIDGDVLKVDLQALNKMDQIRVLTEAPIDISLCPEDDVNPVTAKHMVSATVNPVLKGVEVHFEVSGENAVTKLATTGLLGKAWLWYFGLGGTGTDTIKAWIDMNCNGSYDEGTDVIAETTKTWVDFVDTDPLSPTLDFNLVGEEHCVYATIEPDVDDFPVHFKVTGANNRMGCAQTDDGVAEFCYTGTNPGKDTITAWLEVNGIPGYQPYGCFHDIGRIVEKYYLDHRITGGGNITEIEGHGKTKIVDKISFGGNVGIAGGEGLVGQYQINFHNVVGDALDGGIFHTTEITFLDFKWLMFCPQPDPPDDAFFNWAQFKADGRFKDSEGWHDGYSILVNVSDFGEGKNSTDGIRILLYNDTTENQGPGTLEYDSWAGGGGDFPAEYVCPTLYMFRHKLDGGNIQIHKIDLMP